MSGEPFPDLLLSCCIVQLGWRLSSRFLTLRFLASRMNLVNPCKSSMNMEARLLKYANRGFRVALPGYVSELVDPSVFSETGASAAKGLAWLLVR